MSSNDAKPVKRVAVMGAGAVGSYFGGMLARAGVPVTLVGRAAHVEAIRRDKLFLDTVSFQERVAIAASTEESAVAPADIVLLCVKTTDTENAARAIAPHLQPDAVVVTLQNGVDNVRRICAATGIDAIPAVVYIAVAIAEPGRVKHLARGDLAIGELPGNSQAIPQSARTERVASLFSSAGVTCRISQDIEADLWMKFILNCAGNAVSAIAQETYGAAVEDPHTRDLMAKLIEETVAVARASGVRLPATNLVETGLKFIESIGAARSSTAQDLARGKRTEIDSLNGYVARRGPELGITTPVNFAVYALVKLMERKGAWRSETAQSAS